MKKLFSFLACILLVAYSLRSGDIVLTWDNSTSNPPGVVESTRVYFSTNYFTSGNWQTNIPVPINEVTQKVSVGLVYSAFCTAVSTNSLESKPSNQIRYQRFLTIIGKPNIIILQGSSDWSQTVLTVAPTNGILSGTPPNMTYQPTNFIYAVKDFFVYKTPDMSSGDNITNWYSVHFLYGNNPPIIPQNTDNIGAL